MLSKFSVKRPYTVLVGVVMVLVLGVVCFMKMTTDLLPKMSLPYVLVMTTDMGAGPEEVEENVTSKFEAALASTSNLKSISSISYNSYSMIFMEYDDSANMDSVIIEVQQSLDQAKAQMDDNIGAPIIMRLDPNMIPVMIASVSVEGMSGTDLALYVDKEIVPQLESIEGVASVTANGAVEETIQVTIDTEKMQALNQKISDAIDLQFSYLEAQLESPAAQTGDQTAAQPGDQTAVQPGDQTAVQPGDPETVNADQDGNAPFMPVDADTQAQIEEAKKTLAEQKQAAKDAANLEKILSVSTLEQLLVAQNFDMPAGNVLGEEGVYLVKIGDAISSPEDLKNLVLVDLGMEGMEPIRLSDIATVEIADNSKEVYAKVNGENSIVFTFQKQTGYSTGDVTDAILDRFKSLENSEEEPLEFATLMDQGVYIDIIVDSIVKNMIIGAILAILVLAIFLRDLRPTLIIACAIPLSVVFAVVLMYFSDISLNIISMSGLALGIGMLVDNSIVVIENIFRLHNEGKTVLQSCVYGAGQIAGAITSSTLTTICVFVPIVFTEGITRQLFVDMGLTIGYTLVASLIVALTLVPAMAQGMLRKSKKKEFKGFERFLEHYGNFLSKMLRWKILVFLVLIGMLVLSVFLALSRGTEFMPEMEGTQITVSLEPREDSDTTFTQMTEYSDTLMERLMTIDGIETIGALTTTGTGLSMMSMGNPNKVSMYILMEQDAKISNEKMKEKIEEFSADLDCVVTVQTNTMDMSAMGGSGISIRIKGRDIETMQRLAAETAEILENTKGTKDVDAGMDDMSKEFIISVDREKAAAYKMTTAQVFQIVYGELASSRAATTVSTDIKDYEVYVETDQQAALTVQDLEALTFTYVNPMTQQTQQVPLSEIVSFRETDALARILRYNQSRYINVKADIEDGYNIGLVSDDVREKLEKLDVPDGYSVKMEGEDETINEAMYQLMLMMLLAIILIYLIMVAQFQSLLSPFIIMFTIPLAFTGGFLGLYLTGNPVSVISLIGFVMLSGIIVNNGIVLVDTINQLRRKGMEKKEAIVKASQMRLRPVMMTALTTVISMSTLAMGFGQGTEMGRPMAMVVVGGLTYGTILTLIMVPCLYDALNRKKDMREKVIDALEAVD